jgi:hypothetical protein
LAVCQRFAESGQGAQNQGAAAQCPHAIIFSIFQTNRCFETRAPKDQSPASQAASISNDSAYLAWYSPGSSPAKIRGLISAGDRTSGSHAKNIHSRK